MARNYHRFHYSAATLVVAIAVVLSGCADAEPPEAVSSPAETRTAADFDGPWAAEFADGYNGTTDEFVREVLSDGKVTDGERAEMLTRFTGCLNARGLTMTTEYRFNSTFSYSFDPDLGPDKAHDIENECSTSSGEYPIGKLYASTHSNPDHADFDGLIAQCLTRKGVAPTGYAVSDYHADVKADKYPFPDEVTGRAVLDACRIDPLDLQGK